MEQLAWYYSLIHGTTLHCQVCFTEESILSSVCKAGKSPVDIWARECFIWCSCNSYFVSSINIITTSYKTFSCLNVYLALSSFAFKSEWIPYWSTLGNALQCHGSSMASNMLCQNVPLIWLLLFYIRYYSTLAMAYKVKKRKKKWPTENISSKRTGQNN